MRELSLSILEFAGENFFLVVGWEISFVFWYFLFFFFGVVSDYFFPAVFVVGGGRVFFGAG